MPRRWFTLTVTFPALMLVLAGCGDESTVDGAASSAVASSSRSASEPTQATEPESASESAPTSASAKQKSARKPAATRTSTDAAPSAPTTKKPAAKAPGSFIDYSTYSGDRARYLDGKVVLFFHAKWCSDCRKTEANLTAKPATIPSGLTIVQVDYDNSTALKKKYGITHQFTFVSIGRDGAQRNKWTGTYTARRIAAKA